ncbi:hypothetical protein BpHYR1_008448 [Brachionus plicatilis]|uniref:RNA-directed DNA polymerase from mobile element jockey-like n=1 Tax=Brachionus plicatilis TaxID=10195 RepID=A0A3M7S296_BRAPC|nr:hypothetical protein BpHYR1_008448 [Brachionus plicatilis]
MHHEAFNKLKLLTVSNRLFELSETYFKTGLSHFIPLAVRLLNEYKAGLLVYGETISRLSSASMESRCNNIRQEPFYSLRDMPYVMILMIDFFSNLKKIVVTLVVCRIKNIAWPKVAINSNAFKILYNTRNYNLLAIKKKTNYRQANNVHFQFMIKQIFLHWKILNSNSQTVRFLVATIRAVSAKSDNWIPNHFGSRLKIANQKIFQIIQLELFKSPKKESNSLNSLQGMGVSRGSVKILEKN